MAQPTHTTTSTSALMLMYHSVNESAYSNEDVWTVSPQAFRSQMRLLARLGYSSVTVSELADAWSFGTPLGRVVAVTFDDGYRDLVDVALPILSEVGYRASAYVCPGLVGTTSNTLREGVESYFASWAELQVLVHHGWEIGHHSMNHNDMGEMSISEIYQDISNGKQLVKQHLGLEMQTIAYPWGCYSNHTLETVAATGAKAGLAVSRRAVAGPTSSRFAIPRVGIARNDSLASFLLTILSGYRFNGGLAATVAKLRTLASGKGRDQLTSPESAHLVVPAVVSAASVFQHVAAENPWLLGI